MKNILLLLLVAASINCLGQTIDGIGKIKLGNSYEQIISDLGIKPKEVIMGKKMDKVSWSDLYHYVNTYLLQFDANKKYSDGTDFFYIKCNNASKLIIPTINISGIEINEIELSLYDNKLYMIHIKDPSMQFIDAFKLKHGDGKSKYKTNKVTCSSAYKEKYEETEYSNEITWNDSSDNSIDVEYYHTNYRNSECEESFLSYFQLKKNDTYYTVNHCEVEYNNRKKEIEIEKLKNQTKDL